jgi:nitronate monooxygenase
VHGNYLSRSIAAAGLDPAALPPPEQGRSYVAGHKRERPKAWSQIWGAGQGVGNIAECPKVGTLVDRLADEYSAAWARLDALRHSNA